MLWGAKLLTFIVVRPDFFGKVPTACGEIDHP